jgi:hypothetical protein
VALVALFPNLAHARSLPVPLLPRGEAVRKSEMIEANVVHFGRLQA